MKAVLLLWLKERHDLVYGLLNVKATDSRRHNSQASAAA